MMTRLTAFVVLPLIIPHTALGALDDPTRTAPSQQEESPTGFFDNAPRDGRIVFLPQPDKSHFETFANLGGSVVINNRTPPEMDRVDFDERAFVESLGLTYVSIPISGSTVTQQDIDALTRALDEHDGPILMHCASGSRSAMLYSLHLIKTGQESQDQARQHAVKLGMSNQMTPYLDKALMDTPQRVANRIDAERLNDHVHTLAGFGTRHTLSQTDHPTRGIGAARNWVHQQFERAVHNSGKPDDALPSVGFDAHKVNADGRRITKDVDVVNVVCTIPGATPEARDRSIYVLAHLDSRALDPQDSESDAPGANDDASGVAALIELARALAPEDLGATIVLVATSGEEQGLFGARLHAQAQHENNTNIIAVLNNDTIGDSDGQGNRSAPDHVRVFSEGLPLSLLNQDPERLPTMLSRIRLYGMETDSPSRQLARYIRSVGRLHGELPVKPKLVFRPDRYLRGGDHTPFNELGYPAVRFCEVHEIYEHQHQDVRVEDGIQYGDLPEHVDPEYLSGVTKLNAVTIVHLSSAPDAPSNARILVSSLSNDTTLRWDKTPGATGYEIVMRETTSFDWGEFEDAGDTTEFTIDRSKDNWIFGVRAYNEEGYRSPVAFPIASRD